MGDLSYAQLKAVWLDASKGTKYHTNGWASLMAAIAEAESSGNADAINPNDNGGTQTSWGLWQISNGTHSSVSSGWNDPGTNAQLAIQKLDGQGLSAWGTYDSGAYKAFLSDKTAADGKGVPATTSAVDTAAEEQLAQQASSIATKQKDCLVGVSWSGLPGTSALNRILDFGQSSGNWGAGQVCFLTRSQARAVIGASLLVSGTLVMLSGAGLLAALMGVTSRLGSQIIALVPGGSAISAAAGAASPAPAETGGPSGNQLPFGSVSGGTARWD